ncbi:hypothetical protein ACFL6S_08720 [Candidatus Poribacteria bacterium]
MRRSILISFCFILVAILPVIGAYGYVLTNPGIPDGEQIVWLLTRDGKATVPSTITWKKANKGDRPVYEITTDAGEMKQARYVIDRTDLRLIEARVSRNGNEGKSKVTILLEDECQYLICTEEDKKPKTKKIDCSLDGYDGTVLPFSLRGFPFETKKEVKLNLTPPFKPGVPFWAWRMWKSYAKLLGTEKVTVPAGTFECYKLEVGASGGLIKRVTSKYYFWFRNEPPYQFVKYQDEDGKTVTELMEIKSNGEEG